MPDAALTAVLVAAGYLAGSIPFGLWVTRLVRGEDVRRHGSGNIGATNVWRVFGWKLGLPVVLLDVAKGLAPALLGVLLVDDLAGVLAGGASMLGHWRPLFLGFARGGKTVATAGGTLFAVAPWAGLAAAAVWIALFLVLRYASVASMVGTACVPVAAWLLGEPWPVVAFGAAAAAAVVVLHRANIRRLFAGTENRFELKRRRAAPAP